MPVWMLQLPQIPVNLIHPAIFSALLNAHFTSDIFKISPSLLSLPNLLEGRLIYVAVIEFVI